MSKDCKDCRFFDTVNKKLPYCYHPLSILPVAITSRQRITHNNFLAYIMRSHGACGTTAVLFEAIVNTVIGDYQ